MTNESLAAPALSVIVVAYNMHRELPRTLYSLSRSYQRGIDGLRYEVLVVDNGSDDPVASEMVASFGPEFRLMRMSSGNPSPVDALNQAAAASHGASLMLCVDGARILSPGVLALWSCADRLCELPVIATLAWHLGPKRQSLSIHEGYGREVEDALLERSNWAEDGYRLFDVSTLAGSSSAGWFQVPNESNCIAVRRAHWEAMGGFDHGFRSPAGGYANLDFFKRACESQGATLILLLGEGSFHQLHRDPSEISRRSSQLMQLYAREYRELRGSDFHAPKVDALHLGRMPDAALRFVTGHARTP